MTASDWLVSVWLCLMGRLGFAMSETVLRALGDKIKQSSHVIFKTVRNSSSDFSVVSGAGDRSLRKNKKRRLDFLKSLSPVISVRQG